VNLKTLVAFSLESALNTYLRLASGTSAAPELLAGRVIGFEVTGLNLVLFFMPTADQVNVFADYEGKPDAVIKGSVIAFVLMGTSANPQNIMAQGTVEISGDLDVGHAFYDLLRSAQIDWEELLAGTIGDIPAYQIGRITRNIGAWIKQTQSALRMDVTEYLQEETRIVPTRLEVEAFMDEVDALRNDVDRLVARIERLATYLAIENSAHSEK
jgi:ubiquinone biosynthesis protein UbiJ